MFAAEKGRDKPGDRRSVDQDVWMPMRDGERDGRRRPKRRSGETGKESEQDKERREESRIVEDMRENREDVEEYVRMPCSARRLRMRMCDTCTLGNAAWYTIGRREWRH